LEPGAVLVLALEHETEIEEGRLLGLLDWSPRERSRIAAFRSAAARTSWCLARRLLRDALRDLAGVADAHRRLAYGEQGKPFVPGCSVSFNWAHADGCAALALSRGREVGIDIESVRPSGIDYLAIAAEGFREEEARWVGTEPGGLSWSRFLSLFVQKEAWLKATGQGLNAPVAGAPASLALPPAQAPGRLLAEIGEKNRYFLAVDSSLQGDDPRISLRRWSIEGGGGEDISLY
jgi:phosphopantetheinyl transferase